MDGPGGRTSFPTRLAPLPWPRPAPFPPRGFRQRLSSTPARHGSKSTVPHAISVHDKLGNFHSCSRFSALKTPQNIQLVGTEVAIVWDDATESYFSGPKLRAASPSAETRGEKDIFGNLYGGGPQKDFSAVQVVSFERVGNYALRFDFSDGHRTGIFSYELLAEIAARHR